MKLIKTVPTFPVNNIGDSVLFYTGKLGFAVAYQDDGMAVLKRDEVELIIWAAHDESWKDRDPFQKPIVSGAESFLAGTASCRIEVQDVEKLYEEYKAQGVLHGTVTTLDVKPWGHREFHAIDPHNNLMTFYEVI